MILAPQLAHPSLTVLRMRRDAIRLALTAVDAAYDKLPPRGSVDYDNETSLNLEMAADDLRHALDRLDRTIGLDVGLSADAIATLAGWEVLGEYVDHWLTADGLWAGDRCGCIDDRCIGHHHDPSDDCGCLEPCIEAFIAERDRKAATS